MEKTGLEIAPLCLCGCGKTTHWNKWKNRWNLYLKGHYGGIPKVTLPSPPLCACGCGEYTKPNHKPDRYSLYCRGHNQKINEIHSSWKGGRYESAGYVFIYSPNHPQNNGGYVPEHRLVMEEMIGRYLLPEEIVHHKDENKKNNSPENLHLFPNDAEHLRHHNTGKKASEESKKKMSESAKRRKASKQPKGEKNEGS